MAVFTGGRGRQVFDGTADVDRMFGLAGSDILRGLGGDDELEGGADNDTLDGGVGADRLSGGTGDDVYYVDQAGDAVIEDVGAGVDTMFASFDYALAANVENLRLAGAARSGTGNALANRITGTAGDDTLFGLGGDDVLISLGGNNRLTGGNGDDILRGGYGGNTMIGGAGDDIYYLEVQANATVEEAGGGYDTVILLGSDSTFFLAANIERLVIQATATTVRGNDLDNVIIGSEGRDTIEGGNGDDVIRGGRGNDSLRGNDGDDVLFSDVGLASFEGGAGADRFVLSVSGGGIVDFDRIEGDQIDLHLVDAISGSVGDDRFTFIGTNQFNNVAGEIRYERREGRIVVFGDVEGDGTYNFVFSVFDVTEIVASDLIL